MQGWGQSSSAQSKENHLFLSWVKPKEVALIQAAWWCILGAHPQPLLPLPWNVSTPQSPHRPLHQPDHCTTTDQCKRIPSHQVRGWIWSLCNGTWIALTQLIPEDVQDVLYGMFAAHLGWCKGFALAKCNLRMAELLKKSLLHYVLRLSNTF